MEKELRDWPGWEGIKGFTEDGGIWCYPRLGRGHHGNCWGKSTKRYDGYHVVSFHKNNKPHTEYLHRIIATLFVPNPDPETKICIDHIDSNKDNNKAENLRWVTYQENEKKSWDNGKQISEKCKIANKKRSKPIAQYDIEWNIVNVYKSLEEAARLSGNKESSISCACNGKTQSCGGYRWAYLGAI